MATYITIEWAIVRVNETVSISIIYMYEAPIYRLYVGTDPEMRLLE